MKKITFIAILCSLLIVSGCGRLLNCIEGSGEVITQSRPVEEFHSVELKGSGNLYFTQGPPEPVKIEAENNVLEILKTDTAGGKLFIYTTKCIRNTKPINIYITNEDFRSISISGSGNIVTESEIETDKLTFTISGSGNIDANVSTAELNTEISGSGKAMLIGNAATHNLLISGSGDINAYDLETENTYIDISGSGDVESAVSKELDIQISGSGNVKYHGTPTTVNQIISGVGEIKQVPLR